MEIRSAVYIQSSPTVSGCPKTELPEFAFIGRSNVGKSSLINMLTGKKGLALTSSNPGKTKTINHFLINDEWYLADLPGYGYARISQTQRAIWQKNLEEYLIRRQNLVNVFLLVDANIPPQKSDLSFAEWMGKHGIPFSIIFTKADKSKALTLERNLADFRKTMLKSWEQLPPMFMSSVTDKKGKDEVLDYIDDCIVRSTDH